MSDALRADLDGLRRDFHEALSASADDLQKVKSAFLGPKGRLTLVLRGLGSLPKEARPEAGRVINELRVELEAALERATAAAREAARQRELGGGRIDTTLPGRALPRGAIHPVNRVIREIADVFARMGFDVATGPEVELDLYNFEKLNFPPDHPARDMQDTFFVEGPAAGTVLRTHTSPVQVRAMLRQGAPIRIVAPGRVYRCDSDATHSPMFHQIEGLWVDEGVSFAHLKGVLTSFVAAFFGPRKVRFRPSYFPFVEPGAEMDVECIFCGGAGCRVCKRSGFMEILGAGMVHPNVLSACNVDPERYTGFAFGLGIDRIAMQRWRIDDLSHLFRGDVRFLEQL